jgi:hypothetical protein
LARLLPDSHDAVARQLEAAQLRAQAAALQVRRGILERVASAVADGWLSDVRARALERIRSAHTRMDRSKAFAAAEGMLTSAYRSTRNVIEAHHETTSGGEGLWLEKPLQNKSGGRKRRHRNGEGNPQACAFFARARGSIIYARAHARPPAPVFASDAPHTYAPVEYRYDEESVS